MAWPPPCAACSLDAMPTAPCSMHAPPVSHCRVALPVHSRRDATALIDASPAAQKDTFRRSGSMLRCDSGLLQEQADLFQAPSISLQASGATMQRAAYMQHMQQRYHLVADHQAARAERLVVQQVALEGHVLIVGGAASPGGLLAAIAPFRSKALQRWVPVVILDDGTPEGAWGPCPG